MLKEVIYGAFPRSERRKKVHCGKMASHIGLLGNPKWRHAVDATNSSHLAQRLLEYPLPSVPPRPAARMKQHWREYMLLGECSTTTADTSHEESSVSVCAANVKLIATKHSQTVMKRASFWKAKLHPWHAVEAYRCVSCEVRQHLRIKSKATPVTGRGGP
jgi:hypothetical protein